MERVANREKNPFVPHHSLLTYLFTFSTYGTHLHGDPRGSIDRSHNGVLSRGRDFEPGLAAYEASEMRQSPYILDSARRAIILQSIIAVCEYREWGLIAAHIRTEHIHAILASPEFPDRIMQQFKAYASRALNENKLDPAGRIRWTRHFSVRCLRSSQAISSAIRYVVNQGEPMALFVLPDWQRTV